MLHRQQSKCGLVTIVEELPASPLSCLMLWFGKGRRHLSQSGSDCEVGALTLLEEEALFRLQNEAIRLGGCMGSKVADEYSYLYFLTPAESQFTLLDRLMSQMSSTDLDPELYMRLKERARLRLKRSPVDAESRFRRELLNHGLSSVSSPGQFQVSQALPSLTTYKAFRQQLFRAGQITAVWVGEQDALTMTHQLHAAFDRYERTPFKEERAPTDQPPATENRFFTLLRERPTVGLGRMIQGSNVIRSVPFHLLANMHVIMPKQLVRSSFYLGSHNSYWNLSLHAEGGLQSLPLHLLAQELDKLRSGDTLTDWALKCARDVAEKQFLEENEGLLGRAYTLAFFENQGDVHLIDEYLSAIRQLPAADIADTIAQTLREPIDYFAAGPDHKTAKRLLNDFLYTMQKPHAADDHGPELHAVHEDHEEKQVHLKPYTQASTAPRVYSFRDDVFTLRNGITVVCLSNRDYPVDYFGLYVRGGRIYESSTNCGISHLLFSSMLAGLVSHHSGRRHPLHLGRSLHELGGYIEADVTADISGFRGFVVERNLEQVIRNLSEGFFAVQLPNEDTIELVKGALISRSVRRERELFHRAVDLFYRNIFGIHPYGLSRYGSRESLRRVDNEDLLAWHENLVRPSKTIFTILTHRSCEEVEQILERSLMLPSVHATAQPPAEILSLNHSRNRQPATVIENRQDQRSAYVTGSRVPHQRTNESMAVMDVLQHAFSGPGGLIAKAISDERSPSRAHSFFVPLAKGCIMFTYAESAQRSPHRLQQAVVEQLDAVREQGLSEAHLHRAKHFALGSHRIAIQSPMSLIYELSRHQLVSGHLATVLDYAHSIQNVRSDDICSIAHQAMDPERQASVMVKSVHGTS